MRTITALVITLVATTASAQQGSRVVSTALDPAAALADPTRFERATAHEFPSGTPAAAARQEQSSDWGVPFRPATVKVGEFLQMRLYTPGFDQQLTSPSLVTANDVGSAKAYFSSSRLIPLEADLLAPYRAVGRLFFDTPQGTATCTAAVVAKRVILTAGHCVHSGTTTPGFYTNFVFIPAFRDGNAPYGAWPGAYATVTATWATGGGKPANAADYALIELSDIRGTDGNLYRIGDVLGNFGLQIGASKINHLTLLGYPSNLDSGNKMHQVTSATFKVDTKTNTVGYGSDMMQGSSGGPWVQNFGIPAAGQSPNGGASSLNRIVGITSFGSTSPLPKLAVTSIFDSRLTVLYNSICAHKSGNC